MKLVSTIIDIFWNITTKWLFYALFFWPILLPFNCFLDNQYKHIAMSLIIGFFAGILNELNNNILDLKRKSSSENDETT